MITQVEKIEGGVIFHTTSNPIFIPTDVALIHLKDNSIGINGEDHIIFDNDQDRTKLINQLSNDSE